ncbi:hypothetical protein [Halorubellus sp. PRR65]|uniref:hypothetical protein n=1 Tax=Halorubellus sp. PRR65 TaxID=3098148 RepID=UPI002B260851|nr:hypothetical protein [Halorubellus sp. PRR65]
MTDRSGDDGARDRLPPDVHDTLVQLVDAAIDALPEDERTARASIDTVSRVVANKLPEGDRKDRLQHGSDAATDRLDAGDRVTAVTYLEAMRERLDRAS